MNRRVRQALPRIVAAALLAAVLACAAPPARAQEVRLGPGHYDLALDYDPAEGWATWVRDYQTEARHDPATAVFLVGEEHRTALPDDPAFSDLGAVDAPVWVLSEIFVPGQVFLGVGAPLLERGIFTGGLSNRGQVDFALVGFSGSGVDAGGEVMMWQADFPPRVYFSTTDGLDADDTLDAVTANFHAHYNWAFTQPGLYRLTFRIRGELRPEHGGGETATQVTYTFAVGDVGDSSPLRYAWVLADGWWWSSWMGSVYRGFAPWVFSPTHGWMFLADGDPDSFWLWTVGTGWAWTTQRFFPQALAAADGSVLTVGS